MKHADPERPATRRLFFALWPDELQRTALAHAIHKGVRACGGRAVPAHNLHATLAFLGSVPEARIAELDGIARLIAHSFPAPRPLHVTFDQLEHWARPQILVARGAEAADAGALAATLKDATAAAGFSPDLKLFHAHVTVARKVRHAPAPQAMHAVHWELAAFALIDSRTHSDGPLYSVVASYPLVNAEKAHE
ncbi:MAG TPA: RNA 2',3'-cyclic phosphodiesterase [Candidatus Dormibacteraeota bacterium]|nr:RNA 2',3'-cyclic phosphodiesterase [Candidatus Dormibacteraeota bacterium]